MYYLGLNWIVRQDVIHAGNQNLAMEIHFLYLFLYVTLNFSLTNTTSMDSFPRTDIPCRFNGQPGCLVLDGRVPRAKTVSEHRPIEISYSSFLSLERKQGTCHFQRHMSKNYFYPRHPCGTQNYIRSRHRCDKEYSIYSRHRCDTKNYIHSRHYCYAKNYIHLRYHCNTKNSIYFCHCCNTKKYIRPSHRCDKKYY